MTPAKLRSYTAKDLAQMAKKQGVSGWHSMRKDQLVRALAKRASQRGRKSGTNCRNTEEKAPERIANGSAKRTRGRQTDKLTGRKTAPRIRKRINQLQSVLEQVKNLGEPSRGERIVDDRLVVMVRDPYWLHAYWELSSRSVDRARAALAQSWHGARPILRLYTIADDGTSTHTRDIEIHGGVNNWYLDVSDPPCSFRLEIGYRTTDDAFYCLARSNAVTTPPAGTSDAVDENWADVAENADRIFAMSGGYSAHGTSQELQELLEERLRRPMGSPMNTRYGAGALTKDEDDGFPFAVDAELIVYGVSKRDAHITLKGEPVQIRPDGTFTVRLNMPNRRQVIPIVASRANGVEQRTIVLAIERNTKVMEPVVRDVTR